MPARAEGVDRAGRDPQGDAMGDAVNRSRVVPGLAPDRPTTERVPAPFRASWQAALDELDRELAARDWTGAVVRTGYGPGVAVDVHGLALACDRFTDGAQCLGSTANLRAITRTLTAFRQIERDGVTVSAQVADELSPARLLPT
jgi:hypothetical protein